MFGLMTLKKLFEFWIILIAVTFLLGEFHPLGIVNKDFSVYRTTCVFVGFVF